MLVIESALEKLETCLVLLSFSLLLPAGIPQACKSLLVSHLLTYSSVVPAAPGSAGSSAPAEQFLFLKANLPTILKRRNLGKI